MLLVLAVFAQNATVDRWCTTEWCAAVPGPATHPVPGGRSPATHPVPGGRSPATHPVPGGPSPATHPVPGGPSPATNPVPGGPSPAPHPVPGGPSPATHPVPGGPSPATHPVAGGRSPATHPVPGWQSSRPVSYDVLFSWAGSCLSELAGCRTGPRTAAGEQPASPAAHRQRKASLPSCRSTRDTHIRNMASKAGLHLKEIWGSAVEFC